MAEQSDPHFAPADLLVTTPTSSIEIPAQENQVQKHKERVEKHHQPDRLIKICSDAGFLKTVEVGQIFMTKHTDEFLQFAEPVTCRKYTLPRDDKSTDPEGWIRGNTKIGPVLEVTTSYLQGKHVVEIRIESVNFASPSTRTLPIGERKWTDVEPEDYSPIDYPVPKQLSTLLRHSHLPREDDAAIEFWRIKEHLRNDLERSQHWSDEEWKSTMAKGGGNKKIFQYCTDPSGEILYLRALQGHSGRNLVDPSLKDNVSIPNVFFGYICHIGCAIIFHSIMNSGLIQEDKI